MLPKSAVSNLISTLTGRIPPPVHTAGIEEERPVPAVLVENISLDHHTFHNSDYAGSEFDADGNEVEQYFQHNYGLRVELQIRDNDEIGAYEILGQLQKELSNLSRNPGEIHADIRKLKPLEAGGISYQFYEPTETEINQSLILDSYYVTTDSNLDVLQSIQENYTIS